MSNKTEVGVEVGFEMSHSDIAFFVFLISILAAGFIALSVMLYPVRAERLRPKTVTQYSESGEVLGQWHGQVVVREGYVHVTDSETGKSVYVTGTVKVESEETE